jgi:hypothetical protein
VKENRVEIHCSKEKGHKENRGKKEEIIKLVKQQQKKPIMKLN